MTWTNPRTNWACRYDETGRYTGDYFNAEDYQRIKNNLEYLAALAAGLYTEAPVLPDIPTVTKAAFAKASTINALERSLDALAAHVYDPGIPARKTWSAGDAAPTADDLNRIEGAALSLYQSLTAQAENRPKLAFNLGGGTF